MSLETTEALVANSNVYTWEPPNRVIAARYGLRPEDILRFDTNTSPAVLSYLPEALEGPWDPPLHEYPDSTYAELAEAAADYVGARPEEILVGCGADEVLDIIAKVYLASGRRSVVPVPTYSMYAVLTAQRDAELVTVPRRPDYRLDVEAVIAALPGAGAVWLCAPNNPTGTPESREDLVALLDAASALPGGGPAMILDEAYIEFQRHDDPRASVELLEQHDNLVVLRTFSKSHSLAGLRVGYSLSSPEFRAAVDAVRQPFSVNALAQAAATEALDHGEAVGEQIAASIAERERVEAGFAAIGLETAETAANFSWVSLGERGTEIERGVVDDLEAAGIVVRPGALLGAPGRLRISYGTPEQNDRMLAALADSVAARS